MVLHTKFVVPRYTQARVPRPRLTEALRRHLGERAVLVIAPPGYGKTVLLAEVAEASSAPLLWLQLDDADNDPAAFVAALAEGTAKAFPALRPRLVGLGSADQGGAVGGAGAGGGERALTAIVNALIDASVEEWTLVIDDLHLLRSPASLTLIERLVDFPPPGLRLLIASRIRPPLPLPRWLARGSVHVVDVDDLRFTVPEAEAWLSEHVPGLSAAAVSMLVDKTEGWGAGLYLARGLLGSGGREAGGAPGSEAGGASAADSLVSRLKDLTPAVADYLMEEVFARQSQGAQRFLLDSSVLPQFDDASCAAAMGLPAEDCRSLLSELTDNQAFLQPLDAAGRWFRYHQLFREFLLERLQRLDPQRATRLRLKAGRAAEGSGDVARAVELYLDAGDATEAVRLLELHGERLLALGREVALHRWLVRLGESVRESALAALLYGRVLRHRGLLAEASGVLRRLHAGGGTPEPVDCAACTELAALARSQGDYRQAGEWAELAVAAAGAGVDPAVRAAAWMEQARCQGQLTGMTAGRELAERALGELSQATLSDDDPRLLGELLGALGQISWWQGDVEAAVTHLSGALAALEGAPGLLQCEVALSLASPVLYRHDHLSARRLAERALAGFQQHEARERIPAAYAVLGNIHTRAGDLSRAESLLRSAMNLADEMGGASYDRLMAAGYLAHVLELQGRAEEAVQVALEALWPHEGLPVTYELYVCRSVLADTYLSAGRKEQARGIYQELVEIGERRQYRIPLALVYFGLSYLALEQGEVGSGVELARRSFDMLAPTHAWQLVADQGVRARRVVDALRHAGADGPFLRRIEAALASPEPLARAVTSQSQRHADVRVSVLGELEVEVDGEVVPARAFAAAKARDLLAYLTTRPGESVSIDAALGALWPDEPERARTAVHTALYRLRRALQRGDDTGTRFVLVEAGCYRLDAARFEIDLERFESLLSQARGASQERQLALLRQAVALVRGPALFGLDYSWADALRRRVGSATSDALLRIGELCLGMRDADGAFDAALRALGLEPLEERAHVLAMRAKHLAGDALGVERVYRDLTSTLRDELGVAPSNVTVQEYQRLSARQ